MAIEVANHNQYNYETFVAEDWLDGFQIEWPDNTFSTNYWDQSWINTYNQEGIAVNKYATNSLRIQTQQTSYHVSECGFKFMYKLIQEDGVQKIQWVLLYIGFIKNSGPKHKYNNYWYLKVNNIVQIDTNTSNGSYSPNLVGNTEINGWSSGDIGKCEIIFNGKFVPSNGYFDIEFSYVNPYYVGTPSTNGVAYWDEFPSWPATQSKVVTSYFKQNQTGKKCLYSGRCQLQSSEPEVYYENGTTPISGEFVSYGQKIILKGGNKVRLKGTNYSDYDQWKEVGSEYDLGNIQMKNNTFPTTISAQTSIWG